MKTCVLRVKIDKKNLKNYLLPKCPSDICKEVAYKIYPFYLYKEIAIVFENAYKKTNSCIRYLTSRNKFIYEWCHKLNFQRGVVVSEPNLSGFFEMLRPMFHFDHRFYTGFTSHDLRSVFRVLVRSNFGIFWVTTMSFWDNKKIERTIFGYTRKRWTRIRKNEHLHSSASLFTVLFVNERIFGHLTGRFAGRSLSSVTPRLPNKPFVPFEWFLHRSVLAFFRTISHVCRRVEFNGTHGGVPGHTTRQGV